MSVPLPAGLVNPPYSDAADELLVSKSGKGFEVEGAGYADVLHHSPLVLEFDWYADENSILPSHWHTSTEEWLRVDMGELYLWVGCHDRPDEVSEHRLREGDEATVAAGAAHMAWFPVETVLRMRWTPPVRLVDGEGKAVWINV